MAPLFGLLIKAALPVLVNEAAKKLTKDESTPYQVPAEVPLQEAAKVAAKAAVVGSIKSKTIWFSLALGFLGVIEAHSAVLSPVLGDKWGWVLVAVGGMSAVLRTITVTSMVDKVKE